MPTQTSVSPPKRGGIIQPLNHVQQEPLEQHPERTERQDREEKERTVLGMEGSGAEDEAPDVEFVQWFDQRRRLHILRCSVRLDRVELAALPDDVWAGITSCLTSPRDLAALSCTSRRFCQPAFRSLIDQRVRRVVRRLQRTHGFTTAMPIDVEFTNHSSSSLQLHAVSANIRRSRAAEEPAPGEELAAGEWYEDRGFAGDEYHVLTQGGDLLWTIELERAHGRRQTIEISTSCTRPSIKTTTFGQVPVLGQAPVPAAVPAAYQTWLQLHAQLELFGTTPSSIVTEADHAAQLARWLPCEAPQLQRLYCASEDGWSADQFHQHCDDKGPTLTVILDSQGYVFGGYTDCAWSSGGGGKRSPDAFLFALQCHGGLPPTKMALRDPKDPSAVYHDADCGPNFNDLYVALSPRSGCPSAQLPTQTTRKTRVNRHYESPAGTRVSRGRLFTRHADFQAAEVEVFKVVDGAISLPRQNPSSTSLETEWEQNLRDIMRNLGRFAKLWLDAQGGPPGSSAGPPPRCNIAFQPSEHCLLRSGRQVLRKDRQSKRSRRSAELQLLRQERGAREDDTRRRLRHCRRGERVRLQRKTGQRARRSSKGG